jgi:hypothetical protein
MMTKGNSPFTPGNPVSIELFTGRQEQIRELLKYIGQTSSGKQENIFLEGERGIGKSSFATFLKDLVINKNDFIAIHVFLGGVIRLEELVRIVFEQLIKETRSQSWFNKIRPFFGKYIKEVGLFGISLKFSPPEDELLQLVNNFPEALLNIVEKLEEYKKGIFIALDDIDGIIEKPDFANWYKSLVDKVATHYKRFPVLLMPIGLSVHRDILTKNQPSLMRVFRIMEIKKLSDEEIKEFFVKAFSKVEIDVKPEALSEMVRFSSGLPILMHEIGDSIFWRVEDKVIKRDDAVFGIIDAAENVGKKYLDPKVYRAIRSKHYRSILRKVGSFLSGLPLRDINFNRKEIEQKLNEEEKKVFSNFLRKMKELGIIEMDLEGGRGSYRFTNDIYATYIALEFLDHKNGKETH